MAFSDTLEFQLKLFYPITDTVYSFLFVLNFINTIWNFVRLAAKWLNFWSVVLIIFYGPQMDSVNKKSITSSKSVTWNCDWLVPLHQWQICCHTQQLDHIIYISVNFHYKNAFAHKSVYIPWLVFKIWRGSEAYFSQETLYLKCTRFQIFTHIKLCLPQLFIANVMFYS